MRQLLILLIFTGLLIAQEDEFKYDRYKMVDAQIEARGVKDENVLNAFRNIPRHKFVLQRYLGSAYADGPLPIGYGQTISQPFIVAYMTEIIEPDSGDVVLEIGTGSGYQAAILSEIVEHVYTIEIITELSKSASARLKSLGCDNVTVKNSDGYFGWESMAPFDAIVVTAAAEYIPPPLIEQLKEGGKMIIPVGSPYLVQSLLLVEKKNGEITTESLMPVRFVPFTRE